MIARIVLIAVTLGATAAGARWFSRPEADVQRAPLATLNEHIGPWHGSDEPLEPKVLETLGVDDLVNRVYVSDDLKRSSLSLYIGFYKSQRTGKTIHSPLKCLPGTGWAPLETGAKDLTVTTADGSSRALRVNRYLVQKGTERHLVYFWYQMRGQTVTSEYLVKLFLIDGAVRTNRTDGALVRVFIPIGSDGVAGADKVGTEFVRSLFPMLGAHLPA